MFVENLDKFPAELHDEFVETELDGKKGFMHKTDEALMNSLKNAKREREQVRSQYEEVNTRLSEFEKNQKDAIEKARQEALEEARTKGDVKAIEERYQQQMDDLQKRYSETEAQYKERMDKMAATIKEDKKRAIISELAEDATDKGRKAFKALIAGRVDIDPETGKETFLNEDGSASSLDIAGFKAEIMKDESFSPLLKADVVTNGGGNANGSNGGGSVPTERANLSGNKQERTAAIKKKFPELN